MTALATLLSATCISAQEVWAITDARHTVHGTIKPTRLIVLDAVQGIEAELFAGLPHDPQHAVPLVQRRLNRDTPTQQHLQEAYQGVVDAWSLGISTIPAIVVDQRYVVYGEPDIDRAVARITHYREARP